jgi:signal transduction histidine kinase
MTDANRSAGSVVPPVRDAEDDARATALMTMLRLHWFTRLRWAFLAVAILVLAIERLVVAEPPRPLLGLGVVLTLLGCANLGWLVCSHFLFRRFRELAAARGGLLRRVEILANAQVAVDLLLLTCILRFTGGAESPMAIFYLFHMVIVALLLKRWHAVLHGVWAVLLYAILVMGEWQEWLTPHYCFLATCEVNLYTQPEFVFAALLVVACGVFGILYFTLQIARRLEGRERELRRANAALRESQAAVQDLQVRRSRFMQTAAHQLKSPLAVIQTLTELIRSKVVPPEAIPETCDKIVRRCREGIGQVGELITLARVQQADPARHEHAEADVGRVIADLCERFRPLAEEKDLVLGCQIPQSGALRVSVDQQDLGDCVANLIENAIKYTPGPGKVDVTVKAGSAAGRPDEVSVSVTDTGMGVDPDILAAANGKPGYQQLFDPFRRGNNALTAGIPGTGLGLSIVREVIEQAGGRIHVTSRPNEGSSFTVTFPTCGAAGERRQVGDPRASEVAVEPPAGEDSPGPLGDDSGVSRP